MELSAEILLQKKDLSDDVSAIIVDVLKEYKYDELVELLSECELLLETNHTYFKKLNESGLLNRLWDLLRGINEKCKYRILDNFQRLHIVTLEIEKIIFSQLQDLRIQIGDLESKLKKFNISTRYRINLLMQELIDQRRAIDKIDARVDLKIWHDLYVDDYKNDAETKKILHIASDIFIIDRGNFDNDLDYKFRIMGSAIEKLGFSKDRKIHPVDFADQILQDPECLPLYIREGYDYDDTQLELSDYGTVICQVYDLMNDKNIRNLAVARKEELNTFCRALVEKSIEDSQIDEKPVIEICKQILGDLNNLRSNFEQRRLSEQKLAEQRKQEEDDKQAQKQKELEDQKRYILTVVSPSSLIECDSSSYTESLLHPTSGYGISDEDMKTVKEQISSFSPAVVIKPHNFFDEKELVMGNRRIHITSLSDFYFCLWYKNRAQDTKLDENARRVILIDYYDYYLYSSCYSLDDAGNILKVSHSNKKIWHSRTGYHVQQDIHAMFFSEEFPFSKFGEYISNGEVVLYRTFDTYKNLIKRLEYTKVNYVDRFARTLKNLDVRRSTIDFLDELKKYTEESRNE